MNNTPHRIALIGPGGSGKTTLATALSDRLGLPLIDGTFTSAKRLVARYDTTDEARPRLEQQIGIMRQVDWEVRYSTAGFVSSRSIYDFMVYSDLRGCTWPADGPQPLLADARRWWREVGGYTLVVYVPPFSDAPPEDDGRRSVDPEFVARERRAFLEMSMRSHVHSMRSLVARTPADRLEEIMSAIHYWTAPVEHYSRWERHEGCMAGVAAAREAMR